MSENVDKLSTLILKMRDENIELKAENERLKEEIQMLLNEINK